MTATTHDLGLKKFNLRLNDSIFDGYFAVSLESARGFEFVLVDKDGKVVDATGFEIHLYQRKDGKVYETKCEPLNATRGHFVVFFKPDVLLTPGMLEIQFAVTDASGTLKSTPKKIKVFESIDANTPGTGSSALIDFNELKKAVDESKTLVAESEKIKNETKELSEKTETTATRVEEIRTELAPTLEKELERQANERKREEQEQSRVDAEQARANTESTRDQAESTRQSQEAARAQAEESRKEAETARIAKESARQEAETTRADEEAKRQAQEAARVDAEKARAEEETKRKTAEEQRASKETARQGAETERGQAETARTSAEKARVDAESARATAETGRVEAEKARATAEGKRDTAESARAGAETERESKEQARITAEGKRASAETTRKSAEDERIATQAQNHQTATEDHAKITAALEVIKTLETGQMVAQIAALQTTVQKNTKRLDTLLEGATDEALDQIHELAEAIKNGGAKLTALTEQLATKATADELKAAREALEKQIGTKANASDLASGLAGKVDTATHTVDLAKKADKATVETMQTEAQAHYTDASVTGETLRLIRKNGDETAIQLPKGFSGNYSDLTGTPNFVHAAGAKITMAAEQGTVAITIEEV